MEQGGRWAVVLGVSSGTGAAIAEAVAADPGLHVFGVHRGNHAERAEEVIRRVAAANRRVHLRQADAGTAEGAALGAEELLSAAGRRSVKLFVHSIANASVGLLSCGGERQLKPHQFHRTLDAMASSFVYWTQELLARDLLAPGACLLGLSNPMTDTVLKNTALIAASKAALEMYVRHLAHEMGPRGHRVNLLKFGAVVTPAFRRTFRGVDIAALERALQRSMPGRRLGTVEEVARFVAVLAGESAAWFNGATIDFTGGEVQGYYEALLAATRVRAADELGCRAGAAKEIHYERTIE